MKKRWMMFAGAIMMLGVLAWVFEKPLLAQVRAALVQSADEPGRHVFGHQWYGGTPVLTVPADRTYVIDKYSAECLQPSAMTEARINVVAGGIPVVFGEAAHFIGPVGGVPVSYAYRATGSGPIYADPGTQISLASTINGTPSLNGCDYFITGHYILMP